jgi:hypothetical protein
MESSRRQFLAGAAASALVPAAATAASADVVTPEMFGAKGDGRTNDTKAFAAMSAHVNARGGGTIVLRPVTYVVGEQHPAPVGKKLSFAPTDIIHLKHCAGPIVVRGNGATLRAADKLRYGRFDRATGQPLPPPPRRDLTSQAVPYGAMIDMHHCSGGIEISDLELDGNLPRLWIGGPYGKRGNWEAGGSGLRLRNNSGPERLSRIRCHHQPTDGMMLAPATVRTGTTTVTDVLCEYNGRQGCSLTGGRDLLFERCKFRHTGRAVLHSKPGDGVDIEAEGRPIRNVAFVDCEFSDNWGFGVGAGRKSDADDIRFTRCKFIGTTTAAAWLDRSGMRFAACQFVGSITNIYGDPDPAKAVQFADCTFTDDPRLSPTGKVYLGRGKARTIAAVRNAQNVRFTRCTFRLVGDGLLPESGKGAIYADCTMTQRSPAASFPRGTYIGTTTIRGNPKLEGAVIRGKVTLNGRTLPRTG